jgi:hypothetical protein
MKQDISKPTKGLLDTLKDYKELIAILVFFLGGVLWMFGYFATKKQLTELRCLMLTNVEFIQGSMDVASLSDLSLKNSEDLTALNDKTTLTADEKARKLRLEMAKDEIARKIATAQSTTERSMEKLRSGECNKAD